MPLEKVQVKQKIVLFVIPVLTFFLIYTHQIFWSPIHGDGAVYSHLMKEFSETGGLHWRTTITDGPGESGAFYDHPYFFFAYTYPFVKIFGASDWAMKIPNILVAFFALYLVFLLAGRASTGIIGGYFLALNPTFELQTRQPMLDPLAQVLALASVALIYLRRNFFVAGLVLGLAFLTKGLELLPNLAAIFLFLLIVVREDRKKTEVSYMKPISQALAGFVVPILCWFAWDFLLNQGQWTHGYYDRQFASRFLNSNNTAKPLTMNFVKELLNVFEPHVLFLTIGSVWMWKTKKTFGLLWKYNIIYIFITCLAFTIIKKVALQHYTGIFLSTAFVLGIMTKEFFESRSVRGQNVLKKSAVTFSLVVFIGIFGAALYYWTTPFNKKDLWGNVLAAREQMKQSPQTPVLVDPNVADYYGLFYAAQWYWPNPMYSLDEKEYVKAHMTATAPKEVFLVKGIDFQQFSIEKIILE